METSQILQVPAPVGTRLPAKMNPPRRILMVDDNGELRRLNAEVLIHSGYEVETAEDGAAAWQALQAGRFDLLITDNKMPKMTGVELLQKLHAARIELPVILASGKPPEAEFARYPWLQPDATLHKPYTIAELLQTVTDVLRAQPHAAGDRAPSLHQNRQSLSCSPAGVTRHGPTNHGPHILVVDHDRDLRRLYVEVLAAEGYALDIAKDGATGWEALQARNYQLLITENDLPNLTGVELIRNLRAARMALPVVMAADRLPMFELTRDPTLQLAAMLAKPFVMDTLLDTVGNALRAVSVLDEQLVSQPNRQCQRSAVGVQF